MARRDTPDRLYVTSYERGYNSGNWTVERTSHRDGALDKDDAEELALEWNKDEELVIISTKPLGGGKRVAWWLDGDKAS